MHTVAERLKQFPELSPSDGHMTSLISWEKQRAIDAYAAKPEVLIIGGGQKLVYIHNRPDFRGESSVACIFI